MGKVICVGLGPGAQDLMSVKCDKIVRLATHIAFFRKKGAKGKARSTVKGLLNPAVVEYPMEYPITSEIHFEDAQYKKSLREFYEYWSNKLIILSQENDIVILCEGDPFFYGSFMHLHARMQDKVDIEVVPGITGMSACWTSLGKPFSWGDDSTLVLMGTLEKQKILSGLQQADAVVIMKVGDHVDKVKNCLKEVGMLERAWIVENGSMENELIKKLSEYSPSKAPYFSVILVHGQGRRP